MGSRRNSPIRSLGSETRFLTPRRNDARVFRDDEGMHGRGLRGELDRPLRQPGRPNTALRGHPRGGGRGRLDDPARRGRSPAVLPRGRRQPGRAFLGGAELAGTEVVEAAARPFDAEATQFKLAAEAQRKIQLAGLFDPMPAVTTSDIRPLPHQLRAIYGELMPRTPLRFLLADDPGAGKAIMVGLHQGAAPPRRYHRLDSRGRGSRVASQTTPPGDGGAQTRRRADSPPDRLV